MLLLVLVLVLLPVGEIAVGFVLAVMGLVAFVELAFHVLVVGRNLLAVVVEWQCDLVGKGFVAVVEGMWCMVLVR